MTNIRSKNMKVASLLRSELDKIPGVKLYGPEDDNLRTSIVSFTSANKVSKTVVDKLEDNEIILAERDVGGGTKAVRASPHFFNCEEEATRAVDYIKNILNGSV
jgi:cysteine desulfurase / selenocysteine lyase